MLLQQFHKQHKESLDIHFTFDNMCTGFMRWRERSTTSLSGKHLGIYRALIQTLNYHDLESNKTIYDTAYTCLQMQYLLMKIAIEQYYTFNHWKTVHKFLLKKTPGLPLISKLQVIHIYEADWSLIQKFYGLYKINKISCSSNNVPVEQAGA
jgi:hypothetical protein